MSYSIERKYQLAKLEIGSLKQTVLRILSEYNLDPSLFRVFADYKLGDEGKETRELTIDDLAKIVSFDGSPGFTCFEFLHDDFSHNFSMHMYQSEDGLTISYHFLKKLEDKIMKLVEEELSITATASRKERPNTSNFWDLLHPSVVGVSKSRFETGHYADSVEAALKELNSTVKRIYKKRTGEELDGVPLMRKAFAHQNPVIVLDDLSFETGKNIQQGYMDIFAGAMSGIRNPKAHDNIVIDETRAIHHLFVASLLFYKLEERL